MRSGSPRLVREYTMKWEPVGNMNRISKYKILYGNRHKRRAIRVMMIPYVSLLGSLIGAGTDRICKRCKRECAEAWM